MDVNRRPTLIVLAGGYLGRKIARLASERASLDPRRRVILATDADFPGKARIDSWRVGPTTVAVVLDHQGKVCHQLDAVRATLEAWIEDAFVRASR